MPKLPLSGKPPPRRKAVVPNLPSRINQQLCSETRDRLFENSLESFEVSTLFKNRDPSVGSVEHVNNKSTISRIVVVFPQQSSETSKRQGVNKRFLTRMARGSM